MNFIQDAFKYFSQLNKEASAKHILIKGPNGRSRCEEIKKELSSAEDINVAFSELAAKVLICRLIYIQLFTFSLIYHIFYVRIV